MFFLEKKILEVKKTNKNKVRLKKTLYSKGILKLSILQIYVIY